jgi:hypothetical protein
MINKKIITIIHKITYSSLDRDYILDILDVKEKRRSKMIEVGGYIYLFVIHSGRCMMFCSKEKDWLHCSLSLYIYILSYCHVPNPPNCHRQMNAVRHA